MPTRDEILDRARQEYPQYKDIPDDVLAQAVSKNIPAYAPYLTGKRTLSSYTPEEVTQALGRAPSLASARSLAMSRLGERDPGSIPSPQEEFAQEHPIKSAIAGYGRPTLEFGGMALGGTLGTPADVASGPGGTILGAGLGYAGGKKLADALDVFLGTPEGKELARQTMLKSMISSGQDVAAGAAMEAGGGIAGKALQPIMRRLPEAVQGVKGIIPGVRNVPIRTAEEVASQAEQQAAQKFVYDTLPKPPKNSAALARYNADYESGKSLGALQEIKRELPTTGKVTTDNALRAADKAKAINWDAVEKLAATDPERKLNVKALQDELLAKSKEAATPEEAGQYEIFADRLSKVKNLKDGIKLQTSLNEKFGPSGILNPARADTASGLSDILDTEFKSITGTDQNPFRKWGAIQGIRNGLSKARENAFAATQAGESKGVLGETLGNLKKISLYRPVLSTGKATVGPAYNALTGREMGALDRQVANVFKKIRPAPSVVSEGSPETLKGIKLRTLQDALEKTRQEWTARGEMQKKAGQIKATELERQMLEELRKKRMEAAMEQIEGPAPGE